MNEVDNIVNEMRRAFEGEAWHGPALFEILDGYTPEKAAQRANATHSAWEIARHVGVWIPTIGRRLRGEIVVLSPEEDWPSVGTTSPEAWARLRETIEKDYRALVEDVRQLSANALQARVAGRDYDIAFMLHGLVQHVAYHGGQLSLLAKSGIDPSRGLLRHTLATLAYRGAKAIRGTEASFATFKAAGSGRTPVQILTHIGDLLDWSLTLCEGKHEWRDTPADDWSAQAARFHDRLEALDRRLADAQPLGSSAERLFQGPIADALSHVGQIAMLRRMAGSPVRGENYFKAQITVGTVGTAQAPARVEFE